MARLKKKELYKITYKSMQDLLIIIDKYDSIRDKLADISFNMEQKIEAIALLNL